MPLENIPPNPTATDSSPGLKPASGTLPIKADGPYVSALKEELSRHSKIKWSLDSQGSDHTKVAFSDEEKAYQIANSHDLVARAARSRQDEKFSICVIENISPEYLEVIGIEWKIDLEFLLEHARNPDKADLWRQKVWNSGPEYLSIRYRRDLAEEDFLETREGHLDGVIEFSNVMPRLTLPTLENLISAPNFIHRPCLKDEKQGFQSNTRMSYCRPHHYLYLFLVDAPITVPFVSSKATSPTVPTLRFMYSSSRGGVELPGFLSMPKVMCSIFELLKIFCQHEWNYRILFPRPPLDSYRIPNVLPRHPMIYIIASCLHWENLKYLEMEIKRISFKEIRNPKLETNSKLHDRREDLASVKQRLIETKRGIPLYVTTFLADHPAGKDEYHGPMLRTENWDALIEETVTLEAFLMETFQLLMSSASVQDSQMSINQSRRSTQLTLLALIYVPLSFVTGIFGMNVQQINSSGLDIWVCFATLAPLILLTVMVFLAVKWYGNRKIVRGRRADLSTV
ncbi:hypothetical protein VTL71DRAFT_13714 [Oculimacula yallundae]|uniref:Uncharacterized protein n=1 Tax=Oculimacula yallundae TaxID=86028 RepID=A0ABR4CN42_9HELO